MGDDTDRVFVVVETCPACKAAPLRLQNRRDGTGAFVACSSWARTGCSFTESVDERVQRLTERVAELESALAFGPRSKRA